VPTQSICKCSALNLLTTKPTSSSRASRWSGRVVRPRVDNLTISPTSTDKLQSVSSAASRLAVWHCRPLDTASPCLGLDRDNDSNTIHLRWCNGRPHLHQITDFHTFSSHLALFQVSSGTPPGGPHQRIRYPARMSPRASMSISTISPKSQQSRA